MSNLKVACFQHFAHLASPPTNLIAAIASPPSRKHYMHPALLNSVHDMLQQAFAMSPAASTATGAQPVFVAPTSNVLERQQQSQGRRRHDAATRNTAHPQASPRCCGCGHVLQLLGCCCRCRPIAVSTPTAATAASRALLLLPTHTLSAWLGCGCERQLLLLQWRQLPVLFISDKSTKCYCCCMFR